MGLDLRMTGGADLLKLRQELKRIGAAGLGKQLDKGLRKAAQPLKPAIQTEIKTVMPSGYAPVLSKSMQYRVQSRTKKHSAELNYHVHADGKTEKRDVPALNKGTLRSPRGRRRRTWVSQKVRAGFVDKPFDRLMPDVQREMNAVLTDVANQLKG